MLVAILTLSLCFLAGVANALMDLSSEGRFKKKYFNKSESWVNKWKYPLEPAEPKWYYFGIVPKYKEKFPYSSTWLVAYTDFWHLMQSVMLSCFSAAIVLNATIIQLDLPIWEFFVNFLLVRLSFGLGFEPLYKWLKTKLNKRNEKVV